MASSGMTEQPTPRIVGIGASAGGLVALEEFLAKVPANSGLAYIVVQHLAPTGKALLSELLQRVTTLPVHQARQGERINPDSVYVIPPNAELRVSQDRLELAPPSEARGLRLPINVLFSSLASARGEDAIAVVLSGMGSDGTLGLQAIRAVGGLGVVQSPDSAQFDSMPNSAIDAGCADIQAPAGDLPGRILEYVGKLSKTSTSSVQPPASKSEKEALEAIVGMLQKRTRHDFSLYRSSTLLRRIERRQLIHGLTSWSQYADYVGQNSQELDLLFKEILIGVTAFFRDPEAWEHLIDVELPKLLTRNSPADDLRIWCVGCSTGEEAYSLAIAIGEALDVLGLSASVQVFASDINPEAIKSARRGEYPRSIEATVSEHRLARFFTKHDSCYRINKSIRDQVLFAQHDVILDPPFTRIDLISCRNLLIYFDPHLQQRLLPLFHYSLRPGGLLFLGSAEGIGRLGHLFSPAHPSFRLFQRQNEGSGKGGDFFLKSYPPIYATSLDIDMKKSAIASSSNDTLQAAADRLLLQVFAPAAVVLNSDADIVYISGRTGKYLEPAAGKVNWNIHAMAREGLRGPLAVAIRKAADEAAPVRLDDLKVKTNGSEQRVDVTVQAIQEPASLRGLTVVVFQDVVERESPSSRRKRGGPKPGKLHPTVDQLEIQALREESRAYREEAQAAQEELQSTNEELQSANEELTTSKEEMQSMNEELQTINNELQNKLDDLLLAESDMQNVLNSVEIAILFLDKLLNVRRFTDRAAGIFSLRESDIGRPLNDLTNSLQYPELEQDAAQTLRDLTACEKQIQSSDQRWFSIRIMPYRRLDDVIDGVVITLFDITASKQIEKTLRGHKD